MEVSSLLRKGQFAVLPTKNTKISVLSLFNKKGGIYYLDHLKLAGHILRLKLFDEDKLVNFVKKVMDYGNLRYTYQHIVWLREYAGALIRYAQNLARKPDTLLLRDAGYGVRLEFNRDLTDDEQYMLFKYFKITYKECNNEGSLRSKPLYLLHFINDRSAVIPYFAVPYVYEIAPKLRIRHIIDLVYWVRRWIPSPPKINIRLYGFQAKALSEWINNDCRGTVVIPTGGGKTYIGLTALSYLSVPTLICVTTIELARQWARKIEELLGYEVGILGGGKHEIKDITVATYNSAVSYIDELKNRFDLFIADECLTYDTEILTDKGWIPIGEIVEKRLPVKVLTHKGRFMPVTGWHKIPLRKRLVKVTLEDGTEIKCTEDHLFLTERGWVEALHVKNFKTSAGFAMDVELEDKVPFVYDLTVAEDHSYIANGVVVHNCHHVPAKTFRNVAFKIKARKRLALSATPYRFDGNEDLLFYSMGKIVYKASYRDMVKVKLVSPVRYRRIYVNLTKAEWNIYRECEKSWELMRIALQAVEKYRVLEELIREFVNDKIFVFCQYIAQAEKAYKVAKNIVGEKAAILTSNTNSSARRSIFEEFSSGSKTIIVTTTVLDEGIDVPDAETAIILSGTGTERQMIQRIGRILRYRPGKVAKVIEVVAKNTIDEALANRRAKVLKEYDPKPL